MPKKTKLSLKELKVQSFVTDLETESRKVIGGNSNLDGCTLPETMCQPMVTDEPYCTLLYHVCGMVSGTKIVCID